MPSVQRSVVLLAVLSLDLTGSVEEKKFPLSIFGSSAGTLETELTKGRFIREN